jgi:hypothetical protein
VSPSLGEKVDVAGSPETLVPIYYSWTATLEDGSDGLSRNVENN